MAKGKSTAAQDGTGKEQTQWIFITEEKNLEQNQNEECKPELCQLRHPKSDEAAMFLFSQDKCVSEVLRFQEEARSWFIGETVQSDGSIFMTTPVDVLYLALPYLRKASTDNSHFQTLDQILCDSDFPAVDRLCSCLGQQQLGHIAEAKGSDSFQAYKYNKEKTFTWLKKKVEKVAARLKKQHICVTGSSCAGTFIKSTKSETASKDDYMRYAHGLVSDYLPMDLAQELKEDLGIKAPVHEKPELEEPPSKKAKYDGSGPIEDYSKDDKNGHADDKKSEKTTQAQKKLSKVDKSGMRSLASFFSPKTKK